MTARPHPPSGIAALMVSIVASAVAQLLLKVGVSLAAADGGLAGSPGTGWILGGLAGYGISLVAWMQVLARLPLSYAYPMLGISYVLVYAGAVAMLSEAFTPERAIGVLLVASGAGLIALRN
ncbi:MAG: hypothetical protein ABIX37_01380 [Gammaproteobacteria bacterium]